MKVVGLLYPLVDTEKLGLNVKVFDHVERVDVDSVSDLDVGRVLASLRLEVTELDVVISEELVDV